MSFYTQQCRLCSCTNDDCRQCIQKTGAPCSWIEEDLCSACAIQVQVRCEFKDRLGYDQLATFDIGLPPRLDKNQLQDTLTIGCIQELERNGFFDVSIIKIEQSGYEVF